MSCDPVEKRMLDSFFEAEAYNNNPGIEEVWAESAIDDMLIHYNLLTSVPPSTLKLSPYEDEIYDAFIESFPNFKLDVIEEDSLKSCRSKEQWRQFIKLFADKINDATLGTLIRINTSGKYEEENTIFVVKIQFLAIEIARNRKGLNDTIYLKHKKTAQME